MLLAACSDLPCTLEWPPQVQNSRTLPAPPGAINHPVSAPSSMAKELNMLAFTHKNTLSSISREAISFSRIRAGEHHNQQFI